MTIDLDELERLERSATKGEWKVGALLSSGGRAVRSDECATSILTTCTELNSKADAALIVALRNAAPAMIQELRRLRVWQEASEKELRLLVAERDSLRAEVEGLKAQKEALQADVVEARRERDTERAGFEVACAQRDKAEAERDQGRAQLATAREDALEEAEGLFGGVPQSVVTRAEVRRAISMLKKTTKGGGA